MATARLQIEHLEQNFNHPWKIRSKSRKWLKKQMNKYIRRNNKNIEDEEDIGVKTAKKPYKGWEY